MTPVEWCVVGVLVVIILVLIYRKETNPSWGWQQVVGIESCPLSAPKADAAAAAAGYCVQDGKYTPASTPMFTATTDTAGACAQECSKKVGCNSFSWDGANKVCYGREETGAQAAAGITPSTTWSTGAKYTSAFASL